MQPIIIERPDDDQASPNRTVTTVEVYFDGTRYLIELVINAKGIRVPRGDSGKTAPRLIDLFVNSHYWGRILTYSEDMGEGYPYPAPYLWDVEGNKINGWNPTMPTINALLIVAGLTLDDIIDMCVEGGSQPAK